LKNSSSILTTSSELRDILRYNGIKAKGFGILPKYVMFDLELSLEAKTIYAYFCSYAGNGQTAFPGRERILSELPISKEAYYKHYNQLLDQGYITVIQENIQKFSHNVYTLENNPKKFKEYPNNKTQEKNYSKIRYEGIDSLGYGMIPKAVMIDERLPLKSKGIYAYFSIYTGNDNLAFPLRDTIAYHLGINLTTYYKFYRILLDLNYISVVQRHVEGRLGINDYYLNSNPNIEQSERTSIQCVKIQDTRKNDKEADNDNIQCVKIQYTRKQYTRKQYTRKQDTNINSININSSYNNQSIYHEDGLIDDKQIISSLYSQNEETVKSIIHSLTNYEASLSAQKEGDDIYTETFRLFNNALIDMLLSKETMTLSRREVSASSVSDKLSEYVEKKEGKDNIDSLKEIAITDFINASKEKKISNHLKYMQACIWSAMQKGRAGIKADASQKEKPKKKEKDDSLIERAIRETNG